MSYKDFFNSKFFLGLLVGLGLLILLLVVFRAGLAVGFRKADFSYRWSDNYHRNFAGPAQGFRGGLEGRDYLEAHGIIGQVIKVDGANLVIRGKDNMERIITVATDTPVNYFREMKKAGDLKVNDFLIVIGEPDGAGQISARFIRLLPPAADRPIPDFNPPPANLE